MSEVEGSGKRNDIGSSPFVSEPDQVRFHSPTFGHYVSRTSLRRSTYERIMRIARDLESAYDQFFEFRKSKWPLDHSDTVIVEPSLQANSFWLAVRPYIEWGLGKPVAEQPDLDELEAILSKAKSLTRKKVVPSVPQIITKPEIIEFLQGHLESQTISNWGKKQGFPAPLSHNGKTKHYRLSEIRSWFAQRYPKYLILLPEESFAEG